MLFLLVFFTFTVQGDTSPKRFLYGVNVEHGENLTQVAEKLYAQGIIEHKFWFKVWAKVTNQDRNIKAGYYIFKKPTPIREALRTLVEGRNAGIRVTIPEGATLREIAWLFRRYGGVNKEEFIRLAHDTSYIRSFGIQASSLEGYLFPKTYFIPYGTNPREVIPFMIEQFFQVFGEDFYNRSKEIGFTLEEVVTFASLIEKEAVCDSEKPIISGVYHKRLKHKWPLQCDATIQYILPERKPRLTYSDLSIHSLYNTYIYQGLPPGPICSPGESSIRAALWPDETDYLYFVARGDGTHIFSKTLKEHQIAKEKVREKQEMTKSK
ncbi:MAG: endolytic transglycosylase MltG [bacterium]|nr:endolytic transglycosylase MltG [bacterium]